jgi:ribose 5-phosphate isomerase A
MSPDEQKRWAAETAVALVEDGMTVGLGTGSTAGWFIKALADRRLSVRAVPTSEATARVARASGIALVDLDAAGSIELTVDGADEIGPGLALIKGGGAALLREKLVWSASERCVVIADSSKALAEFGKFPLPIEVVPFGHKTTAGRIAAAARTCGIVNAPVLRVRDGAPVLTDSGNLIYDLPCGVIADPAALALVLKALTGVIEHGLFLGFAERALIGTDTGVTTLYP